MATLLKAIYRFNSIPTKFSRILFTKLEQIIQNFIWNHNRPKIAKAIQNKAGSITFQDYRQYYKATVIKTLWCCYKTRHAYQWNRLENPEIYSKLVLTKEARI